MIDRESGRIHVSGEWLAHGHDIGGKDPHDRDPADEVEAGNPPPCLGDRFHLSWHRTCLGMRIAHVVSSRLMPPS